MKTEENGARASVTRDALKIGIALSGGGVRAAVFHLGVLDWLAEEALLENVTFISTVSGGSLAVGLVYALSGNRWPTSAVYRETVRIEARRRLIETDLERAVATYGLTHPWILRHGRAKVVSHTLAQYWGITSLLAEVPMTPRWIINATTYETGKNWRFTPHRMGDYKLNYVLNPPIPLADALAASAGFPGLIGPLVLTTKDFEWVKYRQGSREEYEPFIPELRTIHLWDGGVYDNLGVEPLFKVGSNAYRDDYNFLIVSDASMPLMTQSHSWAYRRARRLISVATDQVRSLRARSLQAHYDRVENSGAYLLMGRNSRDILRKVASEDWVASAVEECLPQEDTAILARLPTRLWKLPAANFDGAYRHGREVARCTLRAQCPALFHRW